jgi:hypothetical protein
MSRLHIFNLALTLAVTGIANAAPPSPTTPLEEQLKWVAYKNEVQDIPMLKALGEELLAKPSPYTTEAKYQLLAAVCQTLGASRLQRFGGRPIADQLARRVLLTDPPKEPRLKMALIASFDMMSRPEGNMAQWTEARKERATIVVALWRQLATELKDFDPNKPNYVREVLPPGGLGSGFASGIDPKLVAKNIADPDKRKAYLDEVEENKQRSYKWGENVGNFQDFKSLLRSAENDLVSAYSQPPYNLQELKLVLEPIEQTNEVKQRILSRVTQEMKGKVEGVQEDPFQEIVPAK